MKGLLKIINSYLFRYVEKVPYFRFYYQDNTFAKNDIVLLGSQFYRCTIRLNLIVLFFSLAKFSFSQNKYLSVHTGVALSTVKEVAVDGSSWMYRANATEKDKKALNHVGFKIGVDYIIELNNKIAVTGGLGYVKLGAKSKVPIINTDDMLKEIHHFNYLIFPLKFQYLFNYKFDFILFAGVSMDFLLSHERLSKSNNPNFSSSTGTNLIRNIARTNQSLIAGTTILFDLDNRFNFLVTLEYARSIVDFNKKKFDDDRLFHKSIAPSIGLRYLLE